MTSAVSLDRSDTYSQDPLVAFNFALDIQGKIQGYFMEVSGLGSETEVTEHSIVGRNGTQIVKKVPGRLKWEDISLKRGITGEMDIWNWREDIINGGVDANRHNGSIIMYDQSQNEVARWNFEKGWLSKVTGPQPKSDSSELGVEEVTLVHEGIKRVT